MWLCEFVYDCIKWNLKTAIHFYSFHLNFSQTFSSEVLFVCAVSVTSASSNSLSLLTTTSVFSTSIQRCYFNYWQHCGFSLRFQESLESVQNACFSCCFVHCYITFAWSVNSDFDMQFYYMFNIQLLFFFIWPGNTLGSHGCWWHYLIFVIWTQYKQITAS